MSEHLETLGLERLHLGKTPSERTSPENFLASFDVLTVPTGPGCYLMLDEQGQVIYVGKAKNLRARVRAYLKDSDTRYSVKFLMQRVSDVDFLVTGTEKEALLLENSLIKQHKPRYNVRLKDDKTYVSLRINVKHRFPRITVTRQLQKDGARYFGPYSSASGVRETLRHLQRVFPLRTCGDGVLANRTRPCLYYQMKLCTAPCVGYVAPEEYRELVEQAVLVLEGRSAEVERKLLEQIRAHSERLEFEKAAALRDRLFDLRKTLERQRTVRAEGAEDRDVFGIHTEGRFSEIQVLFFRGGMMTGGRSFSFNQREMPVEEVFSSFLLQYYGEGSDIGPEVLVPVAIEEGDTLAEILTERRGAKTVVAWPQRGEKRALVDLANRNAKASFSEKRLAEHANKDLLEQVRATLEMKKLPQRIECFDISTTQGDKAVGSMVTFEGGVPNKARYRRFSIRYAAEAERSAPDDFAMMREVLMRRYQRAIEERDLPDLILVDGGKGQLNVATTVLKDLGIEDLEAVAIAKARVFGEGGATSERRAAASREMPDRFFLPGQKNPVILPSHSPVVHLLARIRDEAHRFAVTYHRKRRGAAVVRTSLTEIPGVGPKRARTLLTAMGSLEGVRAASVEAIAGLPGFNVQLAETVRRHLAPARRGDTGNEAGTLNREEAEG